jgi:hypothetical protein
MPFSEQAFSFLTLCMIAAGFNLRDNDFYVFNPATMTWFDLSGHALGTPPDTRFGHGFKCAGSKLYVHGGSGRSGEFSRPGAPQTALCVRARCCLRAREERGAEGAERERAGKKRRKGGRERGGEKGRDRARQRESDRARDPSIFSRPS